MESSTNCQIADAHKKPNNGQAKNSFRFIYISEERGNVSMREVDDVEIYFSSDERGEKLISCVTTLLVSIVPYKTLLSPLV